MKKVKHERVFILKKKKKKKKTTTTTTTTWNAEGESVVFTMTMGFPTCGLGQTQEYFKL